MAEPTDFRRSEDNGVLTFTFARDAKLNAVSPAMIDGLRAAVNELGDRDDLKVLVIAAEGRYFTAGIDLNDSGAWTASTEGFSMASSSSISRWKLR